MGNTLILSAMVVCHPCFLVGTASYRSSSFINCANNIGRQNHHAERGQNREVVHRKQKSGRTMIVSSLAFTNTNTLFTSCVLCASPHHDGNISISMSTSTPKSPTRRRSWEESYDLLCAYKALNGHCNVPQSEKQLGTWVNRQRIEHARYIKEVEAVDNNRKKNTSMTPKRKKMLDDIGFVWDAMGHTWNIRYEELCEFRRLNGHCVVPRSNGRLGAWVEKQRIEYKKYCSMQDDICETDESCKTILTEERVKKMDDIGFVWDVREKQFEQKLGQLRIFKKLNGNIDPRFMNGSLAGWVRKYEQHYRKYLDAAGAGADEETLSGILPRNRRVALEDVGFCISMFDELPRARSVINRRATWEERYKELKEYKAEYGHCVVPKNYGPLGSWVRAQRHSLKDDDYEAFEDGGQLSRERVEKLDELEFVWDVHKWQWQQTFNEVLQYKEEHNHTNVPMSYGGLGLWVFNQRKNYNLYKKGKQSGITSSRVELLQSIGFEFDLGQKIQSAADERWQMRLNELKTYKETYGSFNVKQSDDPSLYNWCKHQQAKLRKTSLKKKREDALRSIGFIDT